MVAQYSVRIAVARIAKKAKGVPVQYIDDVGPPVDDGNYVTLRLDCAGRPAGILVLTTENFYAALGKVMQTALPATRKDFPQ